MLRSKYQRSRVKDAMATKSSGTKCLKSHKHILFVFRVLVHSRITDCALYLLIYLYDVTGFIDR